MDAMLLLLGNAGLGKIQETLVSNWVGPAFFIVVIAVSLTFIFKRQFRELAGFIAIAVVIGLVIFNASGLFGKGGIFYNIADSFSNDLSTGGSSAGAGGVIRTLQHMPLF